MVCWVSIENRKHDAKLWMLNTHGTHELFACIPGKCISSKSPCVTEINHQIIAKKSQDSTKLRANTINVHLHCESTSVVKISCRKRILLCEIFFCITLQSLSNQIKVAVYYGEYDITIMKCSLINYPFFKTARRRIFR